MFLHQFLTPEAGTVKKTKKYWLVKNMWVLSALEIRVSVVSFPTFLQQIFVLN